MGMKVNGTSGLTFPDTTTLASAGQASVRAWVNFNGTGTVAIRASYNVTSITDNGTGDYTVNFTTALPDANYAVVFGTLNYASDGTPTVGMIRSNSGNNAAESMTTSGVRVVISATNTIGYRDLVLNTLSIFR
jgi:hypothetical protein